MDRRSLLGSLAAAVALAACRGRAGGERGAHRCAFCGMRVPPGSHWAAGATAADGAARWFDTPGCLFRYRLSDRGRGLREPWVTEYYGPAGVRADARAVRYVVGSDVIGPMGADLVPVAPARVEGFLRDHRGRAALTFEQVTQDVLSRLQ